MAQFSVEDGTCYDFRCVAWPNGVDAILYYIIQPDESNVTGAIASSCVQLPEAPSSIVLLHSGILCLALRLSMAFGLWNELFTMSKQFLKCKLQQILSGATKGS